MVVIIPHMWVSMYFREGLPQIPEAAKCVLASFLLTGRHLFPLALAELRLLLAAGLLRNADPSQARQVTC